VLGAWRLLIHKAQRQGQEQAPQQVGQRRSAKGDIRDVLTGLGTVTPLATITVQTQISGSSCQWGSKKAKWWQKGDFLVQIDPRPYQAAWTGRRGTLVTTKASLDTSGEV